MTEHVIGTTLELRIRFTSVEPTPPVRARVLRPDDAVETVAMSKVGNHYVGPFITSILGVHKGTIDTGYPPVVVNLPHFEVVPRDAPA